MLLFCDECDFKYNYILNDFNADREIQKKDNISYDVPA